MSKNLLTILSLAESFTEEQEEQILSFSAFQNANSPGS